MFEGFLNSHLLTVVIPQLKTTLPIPHTLVGGRP